MAVEIVDNGMLPNLTNCGAVEVTADQGQKFTKHIIQI